MQEIALVLSIFLSGVVLGLSVLLYQFVRSARREMEQTVKEYNSILKKVSDANLSMSDKMLQLEERVANLDFFRQTSTTSQSQGFKIK